VWTIYQGVPGTGVLDTGLARSAAFCSSVISGSFFHKQHAINNTRPYEQVAKFSQPTTTQLDQFDSTQPQTS